MPASFTGLDFQCAEQPGSYTSPPVCAMYKHLGDISAVRLVGRQVNSQLNRSNNLLGWYMSRSKQDDLVACDAAEYLFPEILSLLDRKSTRLNSSHVKISYAFFCL